MTLNAETQDVSTTSATGGNEPNAPVAASPAPVAVKGQEPEVSKITGDPKLPKSDGVDQSEQDYQREMASVLAKMRGEKPKEDAAEPSKDAKARTPDGKFAGKGHNNPPEETPDDKGAKQPEAKPADADDIPLPKSWKPALAEKWKTADRELQATIAERERQMTLGLDQKGKERAALESHLNVVVPYYDAVAKHSETFARWNMPPDKALDQMVAFFSDADRDPVAAVKTMIANYNIDAGLLGLADANPFIEDNDPRISSATLRASSLERELEQERRLRQMERHQFEAWAGQQAAQVEDNERMQQEHAARSQFDGLIGKVRTDMPHFDHVRREMAALVPILGEHLGDVSDEQLIREAYQAAVRANPKIRAIAEAEEQQKALKQSQRQQQLAATALNVRGVEAGSVGEDEMSYQLAALKQHRAGAGQNRFS